VNYRHWPRSRKVVYWLAMAGLAAAAGFILSNEALGTSSASAPPTDSSLAGPGATATSGAAGDAHRPGSTTTTVATAAGPAVAAQPLDAPTVAVPAKTYVATLSGDTPGSPSPGAAPTQTVPGSWYGYPSILPIVASQTGWLEVRLAQRPNESTAWIPAADATVSVDHFAIVVDLATTHLSVYKHGREIEDFPAGIGKSTSPTPPGTFFVAMTVPPPSPGYGPLVLVTSAHSDAITDWENSGDAIIAIHGPITAGADALIGTTGAAVSNGCVRLHDADLAQLSGIPAGTPVDIVAG